MKAKVATGDQYKDYSYDDLIRNPGLYELKNGMGFILVVPCWGSELPTPLIINKYADICVYSKDSPLCIARKTSGTITISV